MSWKRALFLFHRWVGIVLCVFFALWFFSGFFMMYVEFPQLTRPELYAGSPPLDFSSATLSPAQAAQQLRQADFAIRGTPSRNELLDVMDPDAPIVAESVRLAMIQQRPAYVIYAGESQPRAVFADNGQVLRHVSEHQALRAALDFAERTGIVANHPTVSPAIQTDQWTVSAALNDHRPLYRVALNDDHGTELYVSSRLGVVVRDTHTMERALNYVGAVTHWLYPTFIRRHPDAWAWMVDVLSAVGTIFAISGLWIGILRWRRRRSPGKPAVPYRGLMRWHYFTGAIFGLCLLTWVLSGLLSMNPGKLNPSRQPAEQQAMIFTGKKFDVTDFDLPNRLPKDAMDAELLHYHSQPFCNVTARDGSRYLVAARESAASVPTVASIVSRAPLLLPGAAIEKAGLLTEYDNYYYSRHPERGDKTLPVIRVQFNDAEQTWFYIDPRVGQVLEKSTATNRLYRWLYNGLHSWDIRWLWERRPLWDITLILFMGGGLLLSLLGVTVGVRRLRYG